MLEDGTEPVLSEVLAADEAQLQERIKITPELIPIEDFGMTSPMMVVGRETSLACGAIDLVGVARSGELLLIEFKTGPQNPDFRQVVAQLLDYGSSMWQMPFDDFQAIARHYFASARCQEARTRGKVTLAEAARSFWVGLTDAEETLFHERLTDQLERGAFHYIAVAQRFSPTMERTVEYLNASMPTARFYAVELVRFSVGATGSLAAFEARTVLKPLVDRSISARERLDEEQILEAVDDEAYRDALRELFAACRGLGLRAAPGTSGTSLRLLTPYSKKPISIAWLFPPGVPGWMGFSDLTLGYHPSDAMAVPQAHAALDRYAKAVSNLDGAIQESRGGHIAFRFKPQSVNLNCSQW